MIDIVINPQAGKGKALKSLATVEKILTERKIEYAVHKTEKPKHAIEIAKRLSENGATDIIAMGGDGTVNEVLNGITNFDKTVMGIIPCGTGNDFVYSVNILLKTEDALEIILKGEKKFTDYMQIGNVRGINIIGTGIDVDILKSCEKSKFKLGKFSYVWSLIKTLCTFKFYKFSTKTEQEEKKDRTALIVCAGNGKKFGGGIPMCPYAIPDDGLMDFVVAENLKKIRIPKAFIKLLKGKILEQDFTDFKRVTHLEIQSDKPLTINVDGELYDNLPFNVDIVHDVLKMYRP